jgi:hypothetical protein
MSSATTTRRIQALPDVDAMVRRLAKLPKAEALAKIETERRQSLDKLYWDNVEWGIRAIHTEIEQEERRIEEYYQDALGLDGVRRASYIADEMAGDLRFAYKEIESSIKNARTPLNAIFWKCVRRELNKRRRSG